MNEKFIIDDDLDLEECVDIEDLLDAFLDKQERKREIWTGFN